MAEKYENNVNSDIEMVEDLNVPGAPEFAETRELRKGLKQRHIQMIALAGTIGTGLFLGSGRALVAAGPAGVFMGYTIMGILVCGVVLSIGEISALVPLAGGILQPAAIFVDPALSFAMGWNAVYQVCVAVPAELVAAAVVMQYWITLNNAIWITVFGFLILISNVLLVRIYGEVEFTFACLKILLVVGMNLMGLIIACGGGPDHRSVGFKYWNDPGPFVQYLGVAGSLGRFMGFWTVFSNAAYAFAAIESIAIAASETYAPQRNIPKAAKRVFVRVVMFYVVTVFMMTLLVPSNDPMLLNTSGTAAQSPFVIAATRAGIKVVPHIINAIVMTSAWSSGNSTVLIGSRMLYGLARKGQAPNFFKQVNRWGVPYLTVLFICAFISLGYLTLNKTAAMVFTWLQDLVASAQLITWMIICITYLRFYYSLKKQGISRKELPWAAPFQPYAAWMSLTGFAMIFLTSGYTTFIHNNWSTETFISAYLDLVIVMTLYLGYKLYHKTKIVSLEESPVARFIEIAKNNPDPPEKPKTRISKFNILWG
ncbi:hypothetical protein VE00_01518 [Pseudogymnoascus sp. WSF 3629]|nr:hypothetical protein VE00_01518 [Pseudogymnoascus sp. WSF 3629]